MFNESMEQHHYNTYSSSHHSNARHTLYLALNRHGLPRKIQIPPTRPLGKLADYTKSLTQTVAPARAERLITQNFGATYIKHGIKQLCDGGRQLRPLTERLKPKPKCNLQNKITKVAVSKKKKRRKCRDDEPEGDHCTKTVEHSPGRAGGGPKRKQQQSPKKCKADECTNNNNNATTSATNVNNPNKKKPKKMQKNAEGDVKAKQKPKEIFAIKKLKPKTTSTTTTTSTTPPTTPKLSVFFSSTTEPDEEPLSHESEEYDDGLGQVVHFVDDVYDNEFHL